MNLSIFQNYTNGDVALNANLVLRNEIQQPVHKIAAFFCHGHTVTVWPFRICAAYQQRSFARRTNREVLPGETHQPIGSRAEKR
jgi:hypothetical protein